MWFVVAMGAIGGILVAVVLKYVNRLIGNGDMRLVYSDSDLLLIFVLSDTYYYCNAPLSPASTVIRLSLSLSL